MKTNLDRELQAALLKLDANSAYECARLRGRLVVWRIWCLAGWATVAAMILLVSSR